MLSQRMMLPNLDQIDWCRATPGQEKPAFVNGKAAANRSAQKTMSDDFIKRMTEKEEQNHAESDKRRYTRNAGYY